LHDLDADLGQVQTNHLADSVEGREVQHLEGEARAVGAGSQPGGIEQFAGPLRVERIARQRARRMGPGQA
jgi:hypothetical protein